MTVGVVRALKGLQASTEASSGTLEVAGQSLQVDVAVRLIAQLFEVLPPPHELAAALANEYSRVRAEQGDSPAAQRLRRAYMEVEPILASCQSIAISCDSQAVDLAEAILRRVVSMSGDNRHTVSRGDALSPHNLGASINASYPNKMKLEVTLRKTHPEHDDDARPDGHWILEGGAYSEEVMREKFPEVDLYIGPYLREDIDRLISSCLEAFTTACAGSVVRLVVSNDGPPNLQFRVAS